jgi:hypothetical protein
MLLIATAAFASKDQSRFCETCFDIDETIYPMPGYQLVSGSTVGQPNSEYSYGFCAVGGGTYTFTFCHDGGSANYDSALSIQGPDNCGIYLVCNDDTCGLQSELIWVAPANGNYILVVDGFSSNVGSFTLAYTGPACETPVEDSTWSTVKTLY